MRTAFSIFLISLLLGCAHANAQEVLIDAEDSALANAREPFRGHTPFAVATLSPFGEPTWFVASFFHYWTGYASDDDAQEHWAVRYVSGDRAYSGEDGTVPATPSVTTWADTRSCPELARAIARFELHERMPFETGEDPPINPNVPVDPSEPVIISSIDQNVLSFWAALDGFGWQLGVSLSENYYEGGGVSVWVRETLEGINRCMTDNPPDMPAQERVPPAPPFDIFTPPSARLFERLHLPP